jgi:DNA-damage-inducible protein J
MSNTVVRARIDAETKDKAAAVLAAIGLTVSDAFRLMMVAHRQGEGLALRTADPQRQDHRGYQGSAPRRLAPSSRAARRPS